MGLSTSKLSYGQVAVFTKQCYKEFVNSGGIITSFNKSTPLAKKVSPSSPQPEVPQIIKVTSAALSEFASDVNSVPIVPFKFLVLGPKTRVRIYNVNTGKNFIIQNELVDNIKIVDCPEITKEIEPAPLKLWVSIIGDINKPLEAFEFEREDFNVDGTCTNVCNQVTNTFENLYRKLTLQNILIIIIIILIFRIIYFKRKQLFC